MSLRRTMTRLLAATAITLFAVPAFADGPRGDKRGGRPTAEQREAHRAEREARHQEKLAKYDRDSDGQLSDAERAVAHRDRMVEHFQALDTDRNGAISFAEFEAGAKQRGKRGGMRGHGKGMGKAKAMAPAKAKAKALGKAKIKAKGGGSTQRQSIAAPAR